MSSAALLRAFGCAQANIELRADQNHAERDEHGADWALDEDAEIAAGDQHGAAEILLEARSEHKAEQDRGGVEAKAQQHIAEGADGDHFADLEEIVVGGVDADTDEEQRARVEEAI